MKKAKQIKEILLYNIKSLIGFEFFFKLVTFLIFTPLFLNLFNLIVKSMGYSYLTFENVLSFLSHPLTLISLITLLMLMTIYTMFDVTTIIIILDQSYHKKKVKILDAVKVSLNQCRGLFHVRNLPLIFMILFLIPFLNLGIASGYISTIRIPEFIMDYIKSNSRLMLLFTVVVILLVFLLLNWMYSIHYMVLEGDSFKDARKKSNETGKGHHIKDLVFLVIIQFLITLAYAVFVLFGILLIMLINRILGGIILIKSIISTIIWLFIAVSFALFTVLSTPISYAVISVLFYSHKEEQEEEIAPFVIHANGDDSKSYRHLNIAIALIAVLALILGTVFTYGLYKGEYTLDIINVHTTEVTAHRGASVSNPENTMSAFKGAKELGADWIELDVQQTKDGEIIVIHDTNFKRTTGVDKNTWELTYEEVQKLDAGSFFDNSFKGEKIPLLSEVIDFAKENNIKLNIELKPTGHETDFEKNVVDIIEEKDFKNDCVVTSQIYEVLENVKAYNEDIRTVYVMSLAYGDLTSFTAADSFSIEARSITSSLVEKLHREGKEVYAWTLNTEDNIGKMVDLNVDNIITDNITLARETIDLAKTSNLVNEYIKLLERIL